MNPYSITLYAHSYVRWAVVILGALLLVQALIGWLGKRPWDASVGRLGSFFSISMDIQLLLGLLLYGVFSPAVQRASTILAAPWLMRDCASGRLNIF
jgi:hypothetical protein